MFDQDDQGTGPGGRRANLNQQFVDELARRLGLQWVADGKGDVSASIPNPTTFGPEDVFHYAYAVFHSPTYRQRYAPFFKIDFPRLPWPASVEQFAALAAKGAELADLHLLRTPGTGGVGGAGGATALQSPGKQGVSFPATGTNVVDKVQYDAQAERVTINSTQYFAGVDSDTWTMGIGGYQPLDKWLKDRRGRRLTTDDVVHYLRMVVALRETRRIMAEIDHESMVGRNGRPVAKATD